MVYTYFPRLEGAAEKPGRLYLGRGTADVRDRPRPDEPAPRRSCWTSRRWVWRAAGRTDLRDREGGVNENEGVTFLLAEQNTNVALRYAHYGYILESGRVVMDGPAAAPAREPRCQGILSGPLRRGPQKLSRRAQLSAPQTLAELKLAGDPPRRPTPARPPDEGRRAARGFPPGGAAARLRACAAFVALDLPDSVAIALGRLQEHVPEGRLVPPENLHLTLLFLDDQPVPGVGGPAP